MGINRIYILTMKNLLTAIFILCSFYSYGQNLYGNKLRVYPLSGIPVLNGTSDATTITDGTAGQVLTITSPGVYSFATPSTVSFGTVGQVPYMNAGGTDFSYSANFLNNNGAVDIVGDLDVDNININDSTIRSTKINGNIILDPNGVGNVLFNGATISTLYASYIGQINAVLKPSNQIVLGTGLEGNINILPTFVGIDNEFVTITAPSKLTVSSNAPVDFTRNTNQIQFGDPLATTTTINSTAPSASRTYTIPDFGANDSFVGSAATQTLTNKTLGLTTIKATGNTYSGTLTNVDGASADASYVAIAGKSGGLSTKIYGNGTVAFPSSISAISNLGISATSGDATVITSRPTNSNLATFVSSPSGALSISNVQWHTGLAGGSNEYQISYFDGTTFQYTAKIAYNSTSWAWSSDSTLKENIKPIPMALSKVMDVPGVNYNWKVDSTKENKYGFIAQDVQRIAPELVKASANGKLSLSREDMLAILWEAVREQQSQIEALTLRIQTLENK